jgi:hypothetical protein
MDVAINERPRGRFSFGGSLQFDYLGPNGAYDCYKCGGTVEVMGSVGAQGHPYYFVRCEVCCVQGSAGSDVEMAVSFWNSQGVYDGEKAVFQKHTQAYRKDKPPENQVLAELERKIKEWNKKEAKREAKAD